MNASLDMSSVCERVMVVGKEEILPGMETSAALLGSEQSGKEHSLRTIAPKFLVFPAPVNLSSRILFRIRLESELRMEWKTTFFR